MEWISLILAGCCEVLGVLMMNFYKKKKNKQVFLFIILSFGMSFFFLSYAMRTLPMGITYAIWTGIGGVGATLIGIILYGEHAGLKRLSFMSLIIISIIGLKILV
ncbi:multidrug efflux SMR transporter [Poseidonibacter sp. 1_MG-2023]|uniref:DMT family transporter n=1 Tax=Poseidonibacter TaxID=2321187 RepID=UPI001E4FD8B1|nr:MULTISPECIES: multidrug efflux SMR transporter [Poseidonibacter]MDO6829233.1 multidrug efflux SMR transporter [Poseidonibacter sp. 1_MG-2023]